MQLVVDASVALRWCFGDGRQADLDLALEVLGRIERGDRMTVPAIWPLEIGNVLMRAERAGQLAADRRTEFLERLTALGIVIDEGGVQRGFTHVLPLALQHGLTPYDASYLELALREALPLASLDSALRKAAVASGVSLSGPND